MKKSKIIGLSLGFTALAAVAVATPFLVTSCSKTDSNEITTPIRQTFINESSLTSGAQLVTSTEHNNIATIWTDTNKTISFTLSTNWYDIIYSLDTPDNIDTSTIQVKWVPADGVEYSLTEGGEFKLLKELEDSKEGTNNSKKYFQVDLVANITADEKKETTPDGEVTYADETTTHAFNKKLTIKLTIAYGKNPTIKDSVTNTPTENQPNN